MIKYKQQQKVYGKIQDQPNQKEDQKQFIFQKFQLKIVKQIFIMVYSLRNFVRFYLNYFKKYFKKRRNKTVFLNPLISKNKQLQKEIEDRLLFLIQLWFDTFMLHEKDFKLIIGVYKQLRQEGVIFPLRDPKNQFFIDFEGQKSPIFESIEGQNIYEEPSKVIAREKITITDIKVDANMTKQEDPIDYQNIYKNEQQIDDQNVNKLEIENMEEMLESIMQNPSEFIQSDQELSQQILENLDKIIQKLKQKFENGDDQSEFFKNKFFELKKKQRNFEEQIDIIKYNKNKKTVEKEQDEQVDLLGLDIDDNQKIEEETLIETKIENKNQKNEKQENPFDFLGVTNEKDDQKENKKIEITLSPKMNEKIQIKDSDPFDFIGDQFV